MAADLHGAAAGENLIVADPDVSIVSFQTTDCRILLMSAQAI